jgi:glutamyl-tRNA reductase
VTVITTGSSNSTTVSGVGVIARVAAELGAAERAEIRRAFERYAAKLLHPPLASLRDESRSGPPHGLLDALRRLFDLEE